MADYLWMNGRMKDECGVFGLYSRDDTDTSCAYYALQALQHRGQESAGMAAFNHAGRIIWHKEIGLVGHVFNQRNLKTFSNQRCILGHVRYSTSESNTVINAQPLVAQGRNGPLAIAYNGKLVNGKKLRRDLQREGVVFMTDTDSEVFIHLFARFSPLGLEQAVAKMVQAVRGSYSLALMTEGKIVGVRDGQGIRPLVIGHRGESWMIASESCAINAVGGKLERDVMPGEMVVLDEQGIRSVMLQEGITRRLCVFEYVYIARTDSIIDGVGVAKARQLAGEALWKDSPVEADLVAGVPDSAIMAAMGYAHASGIPYGEALVKNRYIGRTFIQPTQSQREMAVRIKLSVLESEVAGKRIVLIDDSIVRGTTSRKLVDMLRACGAKEVHMRICSPPVKHPCYFGIDTPSRGSLISAGQSVEQIRRNVGADTLAYLNLSMLEDACGGNGFCAACFSGEYPLDIAKCRRCGLIPSCV